MLTQSIRKLFIYERQAHSTLSGVEKFKIEKTYTFKTKNFSYYNRSYGKALIHSVINAQKDIHPLDTVDILYSLI